MSLLREPICLGPEGNDQQGEIPAEAAEQQNRGPVVGHLMEYPPAVGRLKHLLESGHPGQGDDVHWQQLNLRIVRSDENVLWSLAAHGVPVVLCRKQWCARYGHSTFGEMIISPGGSGSARSCEVAVEVLSPQAASGW